MVYVTTIVAPRFLSVGGPAFFFRASLRRRRVISLSRSPRCKASRFGTAASRTSPRRGRLPFVFLRVLLFRARYIGERRHALFAFVLLRGCHLLERGDDLRLRRAPVLAEQTLLAPAPDDLVVFCHRDGDGVGVDAVRHNLRVRVHGQDRRLGGVELLPAPVSVLRRSRFRGGRSGDGSWRERRARVTSSARATETKWARTWQYVTRYASAGTSGAPEAAATPRA